MSNVPDIIVENLGMEFIPGQAIFNNISLTIAAGTTFGITGKNGSGKSTFTKLLAGTITPTNGNILWKSHTEIITPEHYRELYGYIAPYLVLYEEFTPRELCMSIMEIRGLQFNATYFDFLCENLQCNEYVDLQIRIFSSGMKQRIKYLCALIHNPEILFLDEPTENLDEMGIQSIQHIVSERKKSSLTTIIASNDKEELSWCSDNFNIIDHHN